MKYQPVQQRLLQCVKEVLLQLPKFQALLLGLTFPVGQIRQQKLATYYLPFGEGIAAHRGFLKGEQFRTHIWYLGDDQKTTQTEKT